MASKSAHLLDSFFHYVMHFVWSAVVAALVAALVAVWAWVKDQPRLFGVALGFVVCFVLVIALALLYHFIQERRRSAGDRELRRDLRNYTDEGLSWEIGETGIVQGHIETRLFVRPTGTVELPQPLTLHIACAGLESVFNVRHHPSETDDVEIWNPAETWTRLSLRSPRLYPPGYLEMRLRSKGGGGIRVMSVTRNLKGKTL